MTLLARVGTTRCHAAVAQNERMSATASGRPPAELAFRPILNGVDFLDRAIHELLEAHDQRELKYAVLHLQAAAEILVKVRLQREGIEYVFEDTEHADEAKWKQGNFKSVTLDAALKRLDETAAITLATKERRALSNLGRERNKLQHFGSTSNHEVVSNLGRRHRLGRQERLAARLRSTQAGRHSRPERRVHQRHDRVRAGHKPPRRSAAQRPGVLQPPRRTHRRRRTRAVGLQPDQREPRPTSDRQDPPPPTVAAGKLVPLKIIYGVARPSRTEPAWMPPGIIENLRDRFAPAQTNGWLGEVAGMEATPERGVAAGCAVTTGPETSGQQVSSARSTSGCRS